ncbi:hypothetical protein ACFJQS_001859 [Salmonella enterica]
MKNQPVAVTQPITFCPFPAVCLRGCDMKADFTEKNNAVKLAKRLINSEKLNETILYHGYQEFDDVASQIDFWNQHISSCLLDNNKNISLNEEFKTKAKFYCLLLDEVGNILKNKSHSWKSDFKAIIKNL